MTHNQERASSLMTLTALNTTSPSMPLKILFFRMVRQGQRVIFDLDEQGLATQLRLGSEVDLGTPDWITAVGGDA